MRSNAAAVMFVGAVLVPVLLASCNGDGGTDPDPSGGADLPTVTTDALGTVSQTGVWAGGAVTADGGAEVTARGMCWSTGLLPVITDAKVLWGQGLGPFTGWVLDLAPGTRYHMRAYATNSQGTAYGDTVAFTTLPGIDTVNDVDGNVYHTVTIGNQVWMVENLKVTHFKDGTPIANVVQDDWMDYPYAAWCDYLENPDWSGSFGRLYNWAAVADPKGLAPEGWRVARENDWQILEMTVGMLSATADLLGWRGSDEGGKLKDAGVDNWVIPNTGATNEVGFTAVPGGIRSADGHESSVQLVGFYWTSTIEDIYRTEAWMRRIDYNRTDIFRHHFPKGCGMSVRCIKMED